MKKYVKADYKETIGIASAYEQVVNHIYDELISGDMFNVNDISEAVPEYDSDWCAEENDEKSYTLIAQAARQYARAVADVLFANKK